MLTSSESDVPRLVVFARRFVTRHLSARRPLPVASLKLWTLQNRQQRPAAVFDFRRQRDRDKEREKGAA